MLGLDQGVEVQGAAVQGGAFYPAVDREDAVDRVYKQVVVHGDKKAPQKRGSVVGSLAV